MQEIEFPFGKGFVTLSLDLKPAAEVLLPELVPGVADELAAIRSSVSRPIGSGQLQDLARGKNSVAIVINDITRPSPTEAMLTVLVEKLAEADVPPSNISVLVATGNHVPPTEEDLKTMLGEWRSPGPRDFGPRGRRSSGSGAPLTFP